MKINQPPVSHECIDGEVVIINMATGTYYSLVDLGAHLWLLIGAGCSRAELLRRVGDHYGDAAIPPTDVFLDDLIGEGLVIEGGSASTSAIVDLPAVFVAPRIDKFTDLQEMLLLDAIHEVDAAAGWPYRPD